MGDNRAKWSLDRYSGKQVNAHLRHAGISVDAFHAMRKQLKVGEPPLEHGSVGGSDSNDDDMHRASVNGAGGSAYRPVQQKRGKQLRAMNEEHTRLNKFLLNRARLDLDRMQAINRPTAQGRPIVTLLTDELVHPITGAKTDMRNDAYVPARPTVTQMKQGMRFASVTRENRVFMGPEHFRTNVGQSFRYEHA